MKKLLLTALAFSLAGAGLHSQTVPHPLRVKMLATELNTPKGIYSMLNESYEGRLGKYLFVAESGANRIIALDPESGQKLPFAETAPFPVGIVGWGGPFGQMLMVGSAFGGGIQEFDRDGLRATMMPGMSIAGIDFGHGVFGEYLYAGEWTTGNIWRVDALGEYTLFAQIPNGQSRYLRFSHGGDFGTFLYVTDYASGKIYRIDHAGVVRLFARTESQSLEGLEFGPGVPFGRHLYTGDLLTGNLYQVDPDGTVKLWATGFPGVADIHFAPGAGDGYRMYVVDGHRSVYVVGTKLRAADGTDF
jgi:sugar lactone lactonase YvrE